MSPDRRAQARQAGEAPYPADPAGAVPGWVRELAAAVETMPVPPLLRPPEGVGRHSAVLVLFGPGADGHDGRDGTDLLLIQRTPGLRRHAGQPAFPGGATEPGESPVQAALREAAEEVGLDPSGVEVVGTAPELYIERTEFRVVPVLGWWRRPVVVHPADPVEVASAERVAVAELADPANRLKIRHPSGFVGPAFRVQGMLVWGFTAGLLDVLLALGGWELPWDRGRIEDLPSGPELMTDRYG